MIVIFNAVSYAIMTYGALTSIRDGNDATAAIIIGGIIAVFGNDRRNGVAS